MPSYYVNRNAQLNGDHEVRRPGCAYFPNPENAGYLGEHRFCYTAVIEAKIEVITPMVVIIVLGNAILPNNGTYKIVL